MAFEIKALIDHKVLTVSGDIKAVKQLSFLQNKIDSPDNICEISITSKLVIITTEHPDLRDGALQAPIWSDTPWMQNNINAYDWEGNHLWNISDIVGPLHLTFYGGSPACSKDVFKKYRGYLESAFEGTEGHELFSCVAGGFLYVIDLETRKVLQVFQGMK